MMMILLIIIKFLKILIIILKIIPIKKQMLTRKLLHLLYSIQYLKKLKRN